MQATKRMTHARKQACIELRVLMSFEKGRKEEEERRGRIRKIVGDNHMSVT